MSYEFSPTLLAWTIEGVLGGVLLIAGFATIAKSERARKVMLCALITSAFYELARTTSFFEWITSLQRDSGLNILILTMLLVAVFLIIAPSSVRYTSGAKGN
jgi:hypothetical protein